MAAIRRWLTVNRTAISWLISCSGSRRKFRSDAALEAIAKASVEKVPNLVLYNYPSFSGAYAALFAHLFHSQLQIPCLILPFSSVAPLRVEDFYVEGLEKVYLLDFIGPQGFAKKLLQQSTCEILCFDHRKSAASQIPFSKDGCEKLKAYIDTEKSSSKAVYEYLSSKLIGTESPNSEAVSLLKMENQGRVETVLNYIEDMELRRWSLPDVKSFSIAIGPWRSKINCITNSFMYEQLLEIDAEELIANEKSNTSNRQMAANKLLDKVFIVRLGRGFYGECLGVRADGNSNLSDELGKQLSVRSAAAGLRPIGAVIYLQRNNLKMCLRSTDLTTDTSEVAKAYGGGGSSNSSSFIIRMDEYNQWRP